MLIPSRQVHLGRVIPSVPVPSSNGKMTTSVPIGKSGSLRSGFIRYHEVGRADWGRSYGLKGKGHTFETSRARQESVVQNVARWWRLKSLSCGSPVAPGV